MVWTILKEARVEVALIAIVLVCVLVFLFLIFKEKKTGKNLNEKLSERDILFAEIDRIGISEEEPGKLIDQIDKASRDFFEKELKVPRNTDYSELITMFKEKDKPHLVEFAETMTRLLYAGEEPTKKLVQNLIFDLEQAVNREREEKKLSLLRAQMQKKQEEKAKSEAISLQSFKYRHAGEKEPHA
jgi:hypothetical protein